MTTVIAHRTMTVGTMTPRIRVDGSGAPNRYLTIDGVPAYQIAYSCQTCGLALRRQPGAPAGPLSVAQARRRLRDGLHDLDDEVIEAFSASLPRGEYHVMLLDIRPRLVAPGSREDYFAAEGNACWRNEEFDDGLDPTNVSYYRLGHRRLDDNGSLFQFAVPMTDPASLDPSTVERYAGDTDGYPTAVALSLLDVQGPWFSDETHAGLFHFLLDGHHKMAAAARTGRGVRLLAFLSGRDSLAGERDLRSLAGALAGVGTSRGER